MEAVRETDENGCPLPPLDHLKRGDSVVSASSALNTAKEFDRVGGNPGPKVTPFGIERSKMDEQPIPPGTELPSDQDLKTGPSEKKDAKAENPNEVLRKETLAVLVEIMPHLNEDWLEKCIEARIIQDKWDLPRTASWILDYENLAPRKEVKRKYTGDLSAANDYNTIRAILKQVKHENPPHEYQFYSALKLSQKFPQFSMYSLRQILMDLNYSYPDAVFAIVEGLEELMTKERKTWKDWARNELVYIKIPRGDQWFKYPLCVVKGEKTWSKKKARFTAFPESLSQEIRLVEKALYFYEQKCRALLSKLDAEQVRQTQLQAAQQSGTALECPICFEDYLPQEQVACSSGHEYCAFCLHRSIDEALVGQLKLSPEGNLPCCVGACDGIFPLAMLCHVLPGDRLTKLEERIWADFLARAELPNLCRCYGCGYAEEVEIPIDQVKMFECKNPKCRRKWCRSCQNLWDNHVGKTCKEVSGDPEEMLRKKFDEMLTETVIRTCLKCHRSLQKSLGCNKLTCQCGAYMCYICRKPITGYDHFCKHPTNPGEPCDKCSACKLWEDPEKADQELRRKLQVQLQEELFELKLAYAGKKAAAVAQTASVTAKQPAAAPATPAQATAVSAPQRLFSSIFG